MNYFGKFDAKVSDALGQHPGAHLYSETVHAAHVPSDAVVVPDAQLLFGAEFKRTGVDLVLSGDGREFVVHDYFKGEKHAPLASPDGAHLTGDIVNALAGQVQIAQAGGAAGGGQVIGHVTKLAGTATATRNGVSIILNNGDNVEKGDVVASGSDSTVGITFIDGTVFGLSSNARMVLNEMVYDPNGSNNSSLLSLVAGTITFVAGETAKHGDMKVDTPVATMGIRGTAVLVEIDFSVPGATPDAKFQVLVEPDGTTGSYILFDKTTLTPLAVVDKAGQQINISNGLMSQTTSPLSPEIQKLITDVFSLKFSDSTNTKSLDHFTDSIIPTPFGFVKFSLYNGPLPTFVFANALPQSGPPPAPNGATLSHIAQAPNFTSIDPAKITELSNTTGSSTPDKAIGTFHYFDVNVHDTPTVSVSFASFAYKDANGNDISSKMNALELADIKAVSDLNSVKDLLTVTQGGLDSVGNGTASYTYKVADGAFDFLAAGEKLTLTFNAVVDNNYLPADQTGSGTFTITITGTNDVPVITSPQQNIIFAPAGTDTSGGNLFPNTATHGTLAFTDADLTDTHTPTVELTSALLDGQPLSEKVGTDRYKAFADALSVKITTADDSTGTGTGQVEWTLADLEVYLADLVPDGEKLILTYTVTVTDSQGATSQQNVVVTIEGNKSAVTAWIDTNPIPDGGAALWSDAANWESDLAPTSADDVFIGNDQVNPKIATFPVTVDADAQAKSLSMNGFSDGNGIPTLNVKPHVTLAISGALNLNTSTATDPNTGKPLILATAEAIINNFGTITVGGIAELLKSSVLNNHGSLVLSGGGDFKDQSSITNAGTIELAGNTLNLAVNIDNSGGTLQIDKGAALKILDGAVINPDSSTSPVGTTISDGKVTIEGGGTLDVESGQGVTLDNVEVDGTNAASPVAASVIEVGLSTTALLVLDDGTRINDGVLKILGGSTLDIESAGGATLNDVSVIGASGDTASTIKIGDNSTLVLEGGTVVTDGNMTVAETGTLEISGSNGGTLSDVAVENLGTIQVDSASPAPVLVLEGGTSITDGKMTVNGVVEIGTGGATLDNVIVTNSSLIQVDGEGSPTPTTVTLVLDGGTKIIGGELLIHDQSSTDEGVVEIGTGGATFDNLTVTNNNLLTVDSSVTLTLDDDTAVIGGQLALNAGSTLDVEAGPTGAGATLDGATVNGTNPADPALASTIEVGVAGVATLLVDDDTTIANGNLTIAAGSTLDVEAGTTGSGATLDGVTVGGAGGDNPSTIEIGIAGAATLLLDDGTTISNGDLLIVGGSTLDVEAGATGPGATLDGVTVVGTDAIDLIPASIIEVGNAGAATLTLDDGTTITHGDLTIAKDSTLQIESSKGATLDGVNVTNHGTIQVDGPVGSPEIVNLVLDGGTKIAGGKLLINPLQGGVEGTVEIGTGGATFDDVTVTNNVLTIDSSATLTTDDGTTISGGTIDDIGTLKVTSASEIENATIDGGGNVTVTAGALTLSGVTLDDVTLSGGFTDADTLTIDETVTLNGATITGGTIDDKGALSGNGTISSVITDTGTVTADGGTLTLSGDDTYTGTTTINHGSTLKLSSTGSIADSSDVIDNGTFDISATSGASIVTLSGKGTVDLDTETLTLSNASTTFSGAIDGSGGLTLTAGTETLSGDNLYTGVTTINGGTLALSGTGSIADSSDVIDDGTFDISGTTSGASIVTLSGTGTVDLGAENLTLTDATTTFSGNFIGTGSVIVAGGTLTFGTATLNNATLVGNYAITGTLTIDGTSELNGASITGGTLDVEGELDTNGSDSITGSSIINKGHIHTLGGTLTIDPTPFLNLGLFEVQSNVTMIDEIVTNSQTVGKVTTNGTVQVDKGYTLTLDSSAINGGIVSNGGTIHVVAGSPTSTGSSINNTFSFGNAGIINADGVALTLNGVAVNNAGGTIETTGTNGLLNLVKSTINLGTLAGKITTAAGNVSSTLNGGFGPSSGLTLAIGSLVTATVGVLELTGNIFNYGEIDSVKGTGVAIDLDNAYLTGGTLGGSGLITTGPSNAFGSVLDGVTIASGTKVLASSSTLELTDTITNGGEIDAATHGWLELDNATIVGGTLGGSGSIFTVSNFNELKGVAIANGATVDVSDGTTLELVGTINDTGTISLDGVFHGTELEISGNVSLAGGGNVVMSDSSHNFIGSDGHDATLTNHDTISGAGTIGDAHLTLVNDGTIDATGWNPLIIDTGVNTDSKVGGPIVGSLTVTNNGTLEASAGSTLIVEGNIATTSGSHGSIDIYSNATVEITGSVDSGQTVTFERSDGAGLLVLDDSHDFKGTIAGLTEARFENQENHVDLADLHYDPSEHQRVSASYSHGEVTVTVTDKFGHALDHVTLAVSGNSSNGFEVSSDGHGGVLLDDPAASGNVTVDSNQTLEYSAASSATVTFANSTGTTGELVLADSKDFTGTIAGFTGDGTVANSDLIDAMDVSFADVATSKTTYTENADGTGGTLTLHDSNGQALDSINFDGNYQLANFTIEDDGSGGTLIVDPPVNTNGQPPSNPAVATNQNSSGTAGNDGFAFNFDGFKHHPGGDSHPGQDTFQQGGPVPVNPNTGPGEPPDHGHSNTPPAGDGHDHFGLSGFVKAQLHANDFHFV